MVVCLFLLEKDSLASSCCSVHNFLMILKFEDSFFFLVCVPNIVHGLQWSVVHQFAPLSFSFSESTVYMFAFYELFVR